MGDTQEDWRLPSSPIVETNMCIFSVVVVAVDVVENDAGDDDENVDDDVDVDDVDDHVDDDVDDVDEGRGGEGVRIKNEKANNPNLKGWEK